MVPRIRQKVVAAKVTDAEKRRYPSKHYVYTIQVTWDDGSNNVIFRRYSNFFDFQIELLESFPVEGGIKDPSVRIIPFLPGKIIFRRSQIRDVAMKRLKSLDEYVNALLQLSPHISQSQHVINFFESKQEDIHPLREDNKKKKGDEKNVSEISAPIILDQYTAISDYTRTQPNELTVSTGQVLEVIEKNENGWWFVNNEEGEPGWVPGVYLEKCDGTSESLVTKQSEPGEGEKYVTTAQFSGGEDEVSFRIGVLVEVLQKNLEGWWYISYQGKQGWAPASYLEKPADAVLRQTDATRLDVPSSAKAENRRSLPSDVVNSILPLAHDASAAAASIVSRSKKNSSLTRTNSNPLSASDRRKVTVAASPLSGSSSSHIRPPPKRSTIKRKPSVVKPLVPPPLPPSVPHKEEPVYDYYTTSAFNAMHIPHGISFQGEKRVEVLEKSPGDWWYIVIDEKEGWAPASHITKVFHDGNSHKLAMKPKPPTVPDKPSPVHCKNALPVTNELGSLKVCNKALDSNNQFVITDTLKSSGFGKNKGQLEQKSSPPLPPAKPSAACPAESNFKPPVNIQLVERQTTENQSLASLSDVVSKSLRPTGNAIPTQSANTISSKTVEISQVDLRSVLKPVGKRPTETINKNADGTNKKPPVIPKKPVLPNKPSSAATFELSKFPSSTETNSTAGVTKPKLPPVKPKVNKPKPVLQRFQVEGNSFNQNGNNNSEKVRTPVVRSAESNHRDVQLPSKCQALSMGAEGELNLPKNDKDGKQRLDATTVVAMPGESGSVSEPIKFIAVLDFKPEDENEIGFSKGNEATLLEKSETNWWYMQINDQRGWAPCSYFEPLPLNLKRERNRVRDNLYVDDQFMSSNNVSPNIDTTTATEDSEAFYSEIAESYCLNSKPRRELVRAKSDFSATDDTMISLASGDLVEIMERATTGWCYAKIVSSSITSINQEGWVRTSNLDKP